MMTSANLCPHSHTQCLLYALYSKNWDSSERRTPLQCQIPKNVSICLIKSNAVIQSDQDANEDNEHTDELPWDDFWQIVQKFFGYAKQLLQWLWRNWMWRSWAGGVTRGLWLWDQLETAYHRQWCAKTCWEADAHWKIRTLCAVCGTSGCFIIGALYLHYTALHLVQWNICIYRIYTQG